MENITTVKLPKSELEITGSLPWTTLANYVETALKRIQETLELPGFRKGKVPADRARAHVGDMALLELAAEDALREIYPEIIENQKIDAIGKPEIAITKIARNNPLEFKIRVATLPVIDLKNYKEILKTITFEALSEEVTALEIDETVLDIRKFRAHQKLHEGETGTNATHAHDHPELTDEKNLPVLDDAFVTTLGNFKTVDEFKSKLADNIKAEKKIKNEERKRLALLDSLINQFNIEVPDVLINYEIESMVARMKHDIEGMGLTFSAYLKNTKKTEADVRTDIRADATKRAKLELILEHIAKTESITPDKETIEKGIEQMKNTYPEADLFALGAYVKQVLTRDKVLAFIHSLNS